MEGIIVKVHAKVEDFIFPRHRKIENPECVKKYALVSNLYNEIANEYNAVYDAYQKIVSDYEDKKNELIASSLLRVGISIGMMAITGVLLPDLDLLFDDFSYSGDYVPDTDVLDFDYGFNLDDYYLSDSDLGFDTSMDYDSELDIDNSGQYNISFQGKSVDKLIDQNKTITVHSAGGGPSYQLDVYHDNNNNVWVAKKNSSIAEKITGLTQVSVGGTKFVVSAIKALL